MNEHPAGKTTTASDVLRTESQPNRTLAATTTRRPDLAMGTPLGPRLVTEFIGTFFLVFTVCAATNPKTGSGEIAPLAIGSILAVMVFAGGHVSGGHYNPAVSLAVLVRGKLSLGEWVSYSAVQLAAAVVGGLLARSILGAGHVGPMAGTWKILVVEFVFTFALAYVVLNVATTRTTEGNSYFGLAIGLTVAAGAFAVGGISGGAFNPAVALGGSLLGIFSWTHYWIYIIAPLLGGPVAALVYLYIQTAERVRGNEPEPRFTDSMSESGPVDVIRGGHASQIERSDANGRF